jgi:uncharacterized protein
VQEEMHRLFGGKLQLDWKIAVLIVVSTLLIIIDSYHSQLTPWTNWFPGWMNSGLSTKGIDRSILFFLFPILIIIFIFRQNPVEFGFSLGDWKVGIFLVLGGILLTAPLLWFVGHASTRMQVYYGPMVSGWPWNTLVDLFGWEFLFRGWLLFGLARKFGPEAIWLQAVPFAIAHIGKPEVETLSTIFGGFLFGWIAWRTRSFFYPLLLHWFVGAFMIFAVAGLHG